MVSSLPANPDAERSILGSVLLDSDLALEMSASLAAEHFHIDSHRRIFRHMCELSDAGKPTDLTLLADSLQRASELESVGGLAYLSSLTEGVPRRSSLDHYIKLVRDKWILRSIVSASESALARCSEDEPEEILGDLESRLLELRAERSQRAEVHISGFISDVVEKLHRERNEELVGFSTGIPSIDRATTGIRPGELWVVGALPGRGKTSLGLQVALASASKGLPTMFFSLEMSREQLGERLLAADSGVSATRIRKQWLNASEKRDIRGSAGRVCEWSLYVDDSADLTDRELTARAKLAIRRFGVGLFVVDYLRLIKCHGKELRERTGEAANALRRLAKQENVAVLALSQLRRPENINDRPSMIELKESGDIEAHAHTVLLLYQPQDERGEFTHEDEIIIGKQRNGPLGSEPVVFDTSTLTFKERTLYASGARAGR